MAGVREMRDGFTAVIRPVRRILRLRPARVFWPGLLTGCALVAAAVFALLPATGTYALWNGAVTVNAGTVTAGTVSVSETIAPTLDVVFRAGRTTTTGGVLVTNTSTVTTSVSSAVTLGPGSSAALAGAISLLAWPVANTASCTAGAAVAPGAYSTTWKSAAGVPLTGTLAPGASSAFCIRTSMDVASASGIASGSEVRLSIATTVTAGTTWASTATSGATQSFVDDIAPSAPSGLTVSTASSGTAALSWSAAADNVGVTGYGVYRDGTRIASVNPAAVSYTDTTPGPGGHTYTVTAVDAAGNVSAASAGASMMALAQPSAQPSAQPGAPPAGDPAPVTP